jgi:hypothetical protein
LAKEIGFDLGAITSSQKINVLLIRLLFGLSYDGISGLNFPRLDPMKEIGFNFGAITLFQKNKCPAHKASIWTFI